MTAQTVELREQAKAMDELEAELLGLRMGINGASPEKLQDRRRKEIRRNLVEEMMDDEPVARGAVWCSCVVQLWGVMVWRHGVPHPHPRPFPRAGIATLDREGTVHAQVAAGLTQRRRLLRQPRAFRAWWPLDWERREGGGGAAGDQGALRVGCAQSDGVA